MYEGDGAAKERCIQGFYEGYIDMIQNGLSSQVQGELNVQRGLLTVKSEDEHKPQRR